MADITPTPLSPAAQAKLAQNANAAAVNALSAAQSAVIAASKGGKTPSPDLLKAVESASAAVKSTQLAATNARAAVTSAAGQTPPSTGSGVPAAAASVGNQNGGVSPVVDPGAKQAPYNVPAPSPKSGSLLSNQQGLLNTIGSAALGAAIANPVGALNLASKIAGLFSSTTDVLPASTSVPKSAAPLNPAADTEFGDLAAAQAAAAERAPDTQSPEDIQAGFDDAFANQLPADEGSPTDADVPVDALSDEELMVLESYQQDQRNALVENDSPTEAESGLDPIIDEEGPATALDGFDENNDEALQQSQIEAYQLQYPGSPLPTELSGLTENERQVQLWEAKFPGVPAPSDLTGQSEEDRQRQLFAISYPGQPYPYDEVDAANVDPDADPELSPPVDEEVSPTDADVPVDPATDEELAVQEAYQQDQRDALAENDSPTEVDPDADPELQEPPGTEENYTDLAEPVDPDADPELLSDNPEDEPYTDLAEPVDPDADPELLGGPEEEEGYSDLAEPVDPDADPELEQLGGPPEDELVQLSGPEDVDTEEDPALADPDAGTRLVQEANDNDARASEESATVSKAKDQATLAARYKKPADGDWRVRLVLAEGSDYLYNAANPGILKPLANSNGVVFPYTPAIATNYAANYDKYELMHSNFRGYFYKNSTVGDITITATFTAQDTQEASYMLAVIHFFRSVTKMFYGKDAQRGAPPPMVYLVGLGDYQFSGHPCLVSNFAYNLPADVDYIRAGTPNNQGTNLANTVKSSIATTATSAVVNRLKNAFLPKGAIPQIPALNNLLGTVNNVSGATYVPTKIEISLTLLPVNTRSQVSQQFSLKGFANGDLLKGGFW